MEHKKRWDEITGMALLALSAGLLGISAFLCAGSDLWYDEVFTMGLVQKPLGELVAITARDVHPPLYYIIVKLFLSVFCAAGIQPVMSARLVSVLPFFLCLVYALTKVRRMFGMFAAGLFGFLILTMPQLADYTVEVRMYGWALFFVTAGMLHACEVVRSDKKKYSSDVMNWCGMTGWLLAACYTHYFACVAACMVYLYLLAGLWQERRLKERGKAFLISSLFCGAGYLPWVLLVVTRQVAQVNENYWIQPLSWRSLGGCIKFLFQPFFNHQTLNVILAVLLFLCYAGLFIGTLYQSLKKILSESAGPESAKDDLALKNDLQMKRKQEEGRKVLFLTGCVGVLAGLVAFGFLVSFLIRPVFVYRYMLPAMGVFWLGFAVMVTGFLNRKYVVIPLLAFVLVIGLRNYRSFYGEEMWKKIQMDEAERVFSRIGEEDIVVCNFAQMQAVTAYYLPNDSYLWYGEPEPLIREMYPGCHELVEGEFSDGAGIRSLKKLLDSGKPVWFVGSGNARDEIIEKWEKAGIGAKEQETAMVERYWFNLYRIFYKNE